MDWYWSALEYDWGKQRIANRLVDYLLSVDPFTDYQWWNSRFLWIILHKCRFLRQLQWLLAYLQIWLVLTVWTCRSLTWRSIQWHWSYQINLGHGLPFYVRPTMMPTHMVIVSALYSRVLFEIIPWKVLSMWYLQYLTCIDMPTRPNGQDSKI